LSISLVFYPCLPKYSVCTITYQDLVGIVHYVIQIYILNCTIRTNLKDNSKCNLCFRLYHS